MKQKPNIVYVHTHDTGRVIEPYGYAVSTPNLMSVARDGVVFRRAFSGAPTCSPSRACLLTGQSAHESGMHGLVHRGFALHDYGQHLVHALRKGGYYSALCGIQHIADDPHVIGYDEVLASTTPDMRAAQFDSIGFDRAATESARTFLSTRRNEPFFLSLGLFNTHRPFPTTGQTASRELVRPFCGLPDTRQVREDIASFHDSLSIVDECVGVIAKAIEAAGIAEDTALIFTTDHGVAFPGMKCTLSDDGMGVSLIMRLPWLRKRDSVVCDALVSHLDLYPTLCEWAGTPVPDWTEGRSLSPLLNGEQTTVRDEVFAEVNYHAAYEPMRACRTDRFKLIRRFEADSRRVVVNIDDGPTKDLLLAEGYGNLPQPEVAFYDFAIDPQETVNLVDDPAYSGHVADLSARLERWMGDTNDPLCSGRMPFPEGAVVNTRNCVSHIHDTEYERPW